MSSQSSRQGKFCTSRGVNGHFILRLLVDRVMLRGTLRVPPFSRGREETGVVYGWSACAGVDTGVLYGWWGCVCVRGGVVRLVFSFPGSMVTTGVLHVLCLLLSSPPHSTPQQETCRRRSD